MNDGHFVYNYKLDLTKVAMDIIRLDQSTYLSITKKVPKRFLAAARSPRQLLKRFLRHKLFACEVTLFWIWQKNPIQLNCSDEISDLTQWNLRNFNIISTKLLNIICFNQIIMLLASYFSAGFFSLPNTHWTL